MTWQDSAECRGVDTSLFFPRNERTDPNADHRPAKAICQDCPVTAECLAYAYANNETHGVWGGLTPLERQHRADRRIKTGGQMVDGDNFTHGTKHAYSNLGCRCDSCRLANRIYSQRHRDLVKQGLSTSSR